MNIGKINLYSQQLYSRQFHPSFGLGERTNTYHDNMVETFAIEYKRVLEERDQLHKKCQVLEDENRALKEKNHSLENEIAILENENTFFKTDNNTMYNVLGISPGVPPLPPAEVSV